MGEIIDHFISEVAQMEKADLLGPYKCEASPAWAEMVYAEYRDDLRKREEEWERVGREFGLAEGWTFPGRREMPETLPEVEAGKPVGTLFGIEIYVNAGIPKGAFMLSRKRQNGDSA